MRRKVYSLAAVAAVGALALAGCSAGGSGQSGQSGQSGTAGGDSEGAASSVAASDINPHDRADLQEGGELIFASTQFPEYWNPMNTTGNSVDLNDIMGFVGVSNWIYNDDASFEPNTNYVESFEYLTGDEASNGKQEVILHLNPDAKWNDGTPISWKDYESNGIACGGMGQEASQSGDEATSEYLCASGDGYDHWESVKQGEKESDVVVAFKDIFPDWSAALSTVYPAAGISDPATFNEGWTAPNNDWYAGPYIIASADKASQIVTLEPNPAWWGEKPLLEKVEFQAMDASAAAAAFANSEVTVLKGIINAQQYLQAETRADAQIRRSNGLQWRHFTFNGESGILQDPALRVAIIRGIDRAAITESDLAGIPDLDPKALVKENHFFIPGQEGYVANGDDFGYDPEKAKQELDDLGWKLEEGAEYRTKDGQTLEFEYAMMPDVPTSKNEGELMQSQLAEIGVKVNFKNIDSNTWGEEVLEPGNFGAIAFTWQGTPYPLANINQLYGCGDNLAQNGGANYTRVCDPKIDELSEKIATTPDQAERLKLADEVDKIIWENGMILPIYARMEMTAVPENLANYGAFGVSSVKPEDIGYVK